MSIDPIKARQMDKWERDGLAGPLANPTPEPRVSELVAALAAWGQFRPGDPFTRDGAIEVVAYIRALETALRAVRWNDGPEDGDYCWCNPVEHDDGSLGHWEQCQTARSLNRRP